MPPRAGQNNSSLYAIIALALLFLIATVAAVAFYIEVEDYRTQAKNSTQTLDRWVSPSERGDWVAIIGEEKPGKTNVGAMLDFNRELTRLALGAEPAQESIQVRLLDTRNRFDALLRRLDAEIADFPEYNVDNTGMLAVLSQMAETTASAVNAKKHAEVTIEKLSAEIVMLRQASLQQVRDFEEKSEQLISAAKKAQDGFKSLQAQMQKELGDHTDKYKQDLDAANTRIASLTKELKRTTDELSISLQKLGVAQSKLNELAPAPDNEIAAFKADGSILTASSDGLIYIDLGSKHKVYRGLTFSVYDGLLPIPRDGKGKAQIEVIEVKEDFSIAQIFGATPQNPVMTNDIIANLVWDRDKTNVFVVAGDFDFNRDGNPDFDGLRKVEGLIANWGGQVANEITAATDFVILGTLPQAASSSYDSANDDRSRASAAAAERYNEIVRQANKFRIPIFNLERFLLFTGYESLSPRTTR